MINGFLVEEKYEVLKIKKMAQMENNGILNETNVIDYKDIMNSKFIIN